MVSKTSRVKRFLRAKGLEGSFERFKKLKDARLHRVRYAVGDVSQGGFIISKGKERLVLDDKFRVIGRSKQSIRFIRQNINAFKRKTLPGTNEVDRLQREFIIKIRREERVLFKNNKTKIVRSTPTMRLGRVGVTLLAFKGRQVVRVVGGSHTLRNLSRPQSRREALKEAERGAFSKIPFSPDKVEIVNVEYFYFVRTPKRDQR